MEDASKVNSILKYQGLTTGVIFVATTLYGSYLVLFILSSFILHSQILTNKKQSTGSVGTGIYLTLGYIIFLCVSSGWVIFWVISAHPNLVQLGDHGKGFGVLLYIQNVAESLAAGVADWVLLYRLYVIWNKKRALAIVGAVLVIFKIAILVCDSVSYARHRISWKPGSFILAGLMLLMNIVTTALIAWKLWSANRNIREIGGQNILIRVIVIIVESVAITTAYLIVYLALSVANYKSSIPLLHCLPMVAGIATSLVNVRVGFGWAAGEQGRTTWSLRDSNFNDPVTE